MEKPEGKYAWTVTVGSKGQIVIPKEARVVFDIHPGDHLLILADAKQG
ncbi:MAG: AbrB/MazE/SpoVT family DNA-binding domain-containing protein, partial [Oscillospiraceae bacterium]|nr:AbrB/MazE/SpoVT family DNA-binding domain-containing protein [Oscillospiraceae bacterium]